MRAEMLSTEQFDTLFEAQVLIGAWKQEYNHPCPQSPGEPSYERVVQDRRGGSSYNMSQSSGELLALVVNVPRRSLGPSVLA